MIAPAEERRGVIDYGDILGIQGEGWLSDAIRKATGAGPLSHIAIVTATAPMLQVTEALSRIRTRAYDERLADAGKMWVLKSPLSPVDRLEACRRALKHNAEDYGWGNLLWQEMDDLSRSRWFSEHMVHLTSNVICSELAALCEEKLGLRASSATPNDFWGWWMVERWPIWQVK